MEGFPLRAWLCLGAHVVFWCGAAQAQDARCPDEEVRALLSGPGAPGVEALAAALERLGPPAAGACVRALAETPGAPERRAALRAAICPYPQVWRLEVGVLAWTPLGAGARAALLELLGELGSARDLGLVRLVAAWPQSPPPVELEQALHGALAAILASDGAAWDGFWRALEEWPPGQRSGLLSALGQSADRRGMLLLVDHLERRRGERLATLRALARCASELPWPPDDRARAAVRHLLRHEQPAVRREAALAAARLQDEEALPLLIGMLEGGDPGLASQAAWALREITGLRLPADPERWHAWLDGESTWWRSEAPRLFDELSSSDRRVAVRAVHQLAGHRYPRHALAAQLGGALREADGDLALLLAAALAQLGSPEPVEALRTRAGEESGALREALEEAARSLERSRRPPRP